MISGNFSVSRDEIKRLIELHSGKNSSSVSRNTSFLLAGSKPGPEKIRKCNELGVSIVDEHEFRSMLPQNAASASKHSVPEGQILEEPTLF